MNFLLAHYLRDCCSKTNGGLDGAIFSLLLSRLGLSETGKSLGVINGCKRAEKCQWIIRSSPDVLLSSDIPYFASCTVVQYSPLCTPLDSDAEFSKLSITVRCWWQRTLFTNSSSLDSSSKLYLSQDLSGSNTLNVCWPGPSGVQPSENVSYIYHWNKPILNWRPARERKRIGLASCSSWISILPLRLLPV